MEKMYPMKMLPAFKDYLWGGDTLVRRYGKKTAFSPVAESWELSCHPDGLSIVENGEFAGLSLSEVLKLHPEFTGTAAGEFPVLIKLIDARQALSLQVHPGDEYARRMENQLGKNEMWYVVDCEKNAELILGFHEPLSGAALKEAIRDNTILDKVRRVLVKPGDCFCIPAGLLHAIGAGILIAEIQQSSNVTYRVYDYNRLGVDGKPRPLHIENAVDVTDSSIAVENRAGAPAAVFDGYTRTALAGWDYFSADLLVIDTQAQLYCGNESFQCLLAVSGDFELFWRGESISLNEAGCVFIPAGMGEYTLRGRGKILLTDI